MEVEHRLFVDEHIMLCKGLFSTFMIGSGSVICVRMLHLLHVHSLAQRNRSERQVVIESAKISRVKVTQLFEPSGKMRSVELGQVAFTVVIEVGQGVKVIELLVEVIHNHQGLLGIESNAFQRLHVRLSFLRLLCLSPFGARSEQSGDELL